MTMDDFNLGKKKGNYDLKNQTNYDTSTKTILSNSTAYFNYEEVLSITTSNLPWSLVV